MYDFGYEGKVAVVTGAANGIGRAVAEELVKQGAKVYAMDLRDIEIEGIEKAIHVDLADRESIDKAFSEVPEHIESLFLVAGVSAYSVPGITSIRVNFLSHKYICEKLMPARMEKGDAITIVTSASGTEWLKDENLKWTTAAVNEEDWDAAEAEFVKLGVTHLPCNIVYPLAKMALNLEVARLQGILAAKGVRVNLLAPGHTETSIGMEDGEANKAEGTEGARHAYDGYAGRGAEPIEMAYPILFLNSDLACYVSGALLDVDFGTTLEVYGKMRPNVIGPDLDSYFGYFKTVQF